MELREKMRCIVKDRMRSEGVKQKFLANKCGFDEKTFSSMLNGRKNVTAVEAQAFCFGMGITPNEILSPQPLKPHTA